MLVADGVVYVACDGRLMAFEAKTLKKLGEAIYWRAPAPARGQRRPKPAPAPAAEEKPQQ